MVAAPTDGVFELTASALYYALYGFQLLIDWQWLPYALWASASAVLLTYYAPDAYERRLVGWLRTWVFEVFLAIAGGFVIAFFVIMTLILLRPYIFGYLQPPIDYLYFLVHRY